MIIECNFLFSSILTSTVISNIDFMDAESVFFAQYIQDQMSKSYPPNATWEAELTGIPAFLPLMQSRYVLLC